MHEGRGGRRSPTISCDEVRGPSSASVGARSAAIHWRRRADENLIAVERARSEERFVRSWPNIRRIAITGPLHVLANFFASRI